MKAASNKRWWVVLGVVSLTWCGLWARVRAQDKPIDKPTRVASVRHIMTGIHQPNCGAIGGLLKDQGPKDAEGWAAIAGHAALLNESSYLLMDNNRCPDAVWSEAIAAMRKQSTALFEAAGKQSLPAAREAFEGLTGACAACHSAHKRPPIPKVSDRPARVGDIMAGLNKPNCGALGNLLKDNGPADDAQWEDVVQRAGLLNEAGHLLMQNDRCPDGVWKDACTSLRENASKVVHFAGLRNLQESRTAFEGLTTACSNCHKVHRKAAG